MTQGVGNIQLSRLTLVTALLSDVGCQRSVNEDFALSEAPPAETLEAERKGTLMVVADGLGGHAGGEVASRMAAEVIRRVYYTSPAEPAEALREAFVEANHLIWETARRHPLLRGMGTTCTALAIRGQEAFAGHVGDTRLYLIRGGRIYQMTEDDSEVMEYVRQGRLSREAAARHPEKTSCSRRWVPGPPSRRVSGSAPYGYPLGISFCWCRTACTTLSPMRKCTPSCSTRRRTSPVNVWLTSPKHVAATTTSRSGWCGRPVQKGRRGQSGACLRCCARPGKRGSSHDRQCNWHLSR